jgi:hypothetical protein
LAWAEVEAEARSRCEWDGWEDNRKEGIGEANVLCDMMSWRRQQAAGNVGLDLESQAWRQEVGQGQCIRKSVSGLGHFLRRESSQRKHCEEGLNLEPERDRKEEVEDILGNSNVWRVGWVGAGAG